MYTLSASWLDFLDNIHNNVEIMLNNGTKVFVKPSMTPQLFDRAAKCYDEQIDVTSTIGLHTNNHFAENNRLAITNDGKLYLTPFKKMSDKGFIKSHVKDDSCYLSKLR